MDSAENGVDRLMSDDLTELCDGLAELSIGIRKVGRIAAQLKEPREQKAARKMLLQFKLEVQEVLLALM